GLHDNTVFRVDELLLVDLYLFDQNLGRPSLLMDALWIDYGQPAGGRKPQSAVGRLQTRGLLPAVSLDVQKAIFRPIGRRRDACSDAIREVIQIAAPGAVYSLIAVHPEPALVILENAEDPVVEKTVFGRYLNDLSIL